MGNSDQEINQQIAQVLVDLQCDDKKKQIEAAQIAGEQRIIQSVPLLMNLLENIIDPYESITRQLLETIVWALGEIGDRQAIPILIANLHNAFYKIQTTAIDALGKMEVEEAVNPLWEIAQNLSAPEFVRLTAIDAMGKIASHDARAHLQEFAESQQIPKPLQEKASQALHSIQGFW